MISLALVMALDVARLPLSYVAYDRSCLVKFDLAYRQEGLVAENPRLTPLPTGEVLSDPYAPIALSPDSGHIAFASENADGVHVHLFNVKSEQIEESWECTLHRPAVGVMWAPNNRRFVVYDDSKRLFVADLDSKKTVQLPPVKKAIWNSKSILLVEPSSESTSEPLGEYSNIVEVLTSRTFLRNCNQDAVLQKLSNSDRLGYEMLAVPFTYIDNQHAIVEQNCKGAPLHPEAPDVAEPVDQQYDEIVSPKSMIALPRRAAWLDTPPRYSSVEKNVVMVSAVPLYLSIIAKPDHR